MSPVRINIDGRELTAVPGQTILDVAKENGIHIPTLCQSGDLKIYGSCGICLVEVEGVPKLLRSCGTAISDGMIINTNSKKIQEARNLALELMLSDHRGDCSAPCLLACPVNCDAQGYTALIADGKFREALALIMEYVPFASTIGRVCPALCEDACRRELVEEPISIRAIKRMVGDLNLKSDDPYVPPVAPDTGKKVAIVGGGPAGLTAAYFLRRAGHSVFLFEALPHLGGMLRYGIPEYRLPNSVLDQEIQGILDLGVEARTDYALGEDYTVEDLRRRGFDAIYLAIGAQSSRVMGVEGEDISGVLGGTEFLRDFNQGEEMELGERVLVVGGGNTAMDAARTARRLGSEVMVVYRRAREQMPAQDIEVEEAEEEGIDFYLLANPVKIEGNGSVERVICQKMRLGEPDASGRARPEPIPHDFFTLEVDNVIAAIGQDVVTEHLDKEIQRSRWDTIAIDEDTFLTNRPGVFAGGDAVTGPSIAVEAVAAGKRAAEVIGGYLEGVIRPYHTEYNRVIEDLTEEDFADREKETRAQMPTRSPEERISDFLEVEQGLSEEAARKDASRCLECGCFDRFECILREYSTKYGIVASRITGEENDYEEEGDHPFIVRDRNKCILCGLCVRTCHEVIGASAIGFVNRGFDTYVSPSMELPLQETTCVSCGQCVYVCPTGALMERIPFSKPGPFELECTETTCGFCGVGCSLRLETLGDRIARSTPVKGPVNQGYLCKRGRFAFPLVEDKERLQTPLIRREGELREATWEEALELIGERVMELKERSGGDSLALFAGPNYSNEELYLLQKLGRAVLGTNHINSLTVGKNPATEILGLGASTASFDELKTADFILSVGVSNEEYPIACHHIIQAAKENQNLWVVDEGEGGLEEHASSVLHSSEGESTLFIQALLRSALEKDLVDGDFLSEYVEDWKAVEETISGLKLEQILSDTRFSAQDISSLVEAYAQAKRPILVLGTQRLSAEAQTLFLDLAVLLGAVGRPRRGVILLQGDCNTQGLLDMGVQPHYLPGYQDFQAEVLEKFSSYWNAPYLPTGAGMEKESLLQAISKKEIRALLVFGEDPPPDLASQLSQVEFLVVQDLFLTDLAREAQVVLPMASFAETLGSYTNSERRIQRVTPAMKPRSTYSNLEVIGKLMQAMGYPQEEKVQDIWNEMRILTPLFASIPWKSHEDHPFWLQPGLSMEHLKGVKCILPPEKGSLWKKDTVGSSLKAWLGKFWQEKGISC